MATSNVSTFEYHLVSYANFNMMQTYDQIMMTSKLEFVNIASLGYASQLKLDQ